MLLHYFTKERLAELSPQLQPGVPTGLRYYPLLTPGERFPTFDPSKQPCLEPRPAEDAIFLQGLLEGMADIEGTAYRCQAVLNIMQARDQERVSLQPVLCMANIEGTAFRYLAVLNIMQARDQERGCHCSLCCVCA